MTGRATAAIGRIGRTGRDATADLFDQRSPFGRLALVHVLMTAGDTLLTVSLAGSLFFSISPDAARRKVLLYLFLTIAPFAVVAPLLAPLIDRSRGARRAMVVFSAAARAGVCLFMVGHLKSLLLFPAAFLMLVLSKLYLVTKGALVPLLAEGKAVLPGRRRGSRPDEREAHEALPGNAPSAGEAATAGSNAATKVPLATLNARLGLLASLSGLAAGLPAAAVLELFGAPWVLRLDVLVFIAATVAALRLPLSRASWDKSEPAGTRKQEEAPRSTTEGVPGATSTVSEPDVASGGRTRADPKHPRDHVGVARGLHALGLRHTPSEVTLALTVTSVLRGLVGFLTFLLAFELRKRGVGREWYGFVLAASIAGSLVGVLLVAQARRTLNEQQILVFSVWIVAAVAGLVAFLGGI
ncbi:MAG TPA: hypothetical protein VEJ87_04925, partial [Acidimicrobiales bacterium]|nr:hypothetical protein [Acidimicrobiales bacterium]